jgi:hypothetical protein
MSVPPLALSDTQLDLIHRLAWPLLPADRGAYLEAVTAALQLEPTLGDGVIHRIAVECQRRFWTPPEVEKMPPRWAREAPRFEKTSRRAY